LARPHFEKNRRTLSAAKRKMLEKIGEQCGDVARRRGVNLFEKILDFVEGDEAALGYEGKRTKFLKDGSIIEEPWITPEMRLVALKEALKYVYPQLKATTVMELSAQTDAEEDSEPLSREELVRIIQQDPFFQIQPNEIIDVTPKDPMKD